jgi:hypothetical protein
MSPIGKIGSPIEKPRGNTIVNQDKSIRNSYKDYRFKDYVKDLETTQKRTEQERKVSKVNSLYNSIDFNFNTIHENSKARDHISKTPKLTETL